MTRDGNHPFKIIATSSLGPNVKHELDFSVEIEPFIEEPVPTP